MQLTVNTVDWEVLESLPQGTSIHPLLNDDLPEELFVDEPPWPSDSCVQYQEVVEIYSLVKASLSDNVRAATDAITSVLVNEWFAFPWDSKSIPIADNFVGLLSPERVSQLLGCFTALSYSELDDAVLSLPSDEWQRFQILHQGSHEMFTGYFRQWEELVHYAKARGCGVLVHIG